MVTDKQIAAAWNAWYDSQGTVRDGVLAAVEAAEATAWQPIETAPKGGLVLLFCPDRGNPTNRERIELGYADNGNGSHHAWATHWRPLPGVPR